MIDLVIILFGTTMLYVFATSRIEAYIKVLAAQGLLLFALVVLDFRSTGVWNLVFLGVETLGLKTVAIPLFLMNVVRRNEITRDVEPYIGQFYSLIIASVTFALGFGIGFWARAAVGDIKPLYFGISISTIMSGLILIITRKKIITHILGYMMMENGIFLLSLSVANEMPLLVNLGVLLDIFVGIFLIVLLFNRIQAVFDEDHIDTLTSLKD